MGSPQSSESTLLSRLPKIRRATASDAGAISALLKRAFLEFEPLYTPEAFAATVQPEAGILKRLEEGPLWVAQNNAGVIGTVSAICSGSSTRVRGMAVDPGARGQKIGKALLDLIEDFTREQGLKRMSLYTTAFLLSAIRLYQTSGFEFTGEKTKPYGTELLGMIKTLGSRRR